MVISRRVPVKRRAVTESLKDARRDVILAAAQELFCEKPFESITMATIAADAGLAKGTLYLYFRTREEIFLALLTREVRAWFASLTEVATSFVSPENALDWIAASLAARSELLRLSGLLHSVLEQNLSVETAREFKLTFEIQLSAAVPGLAQALHLQSQEEARRFLRWLQVCTIGLYQMACPTSVIRAAMAGEPRLAHMIIDFKTELRAMLGAMLTGMREKELRNGS